MDRTDLTKMMREIEWSGEELQTFAWTMKLEGGQAKLSQVAMFHRNFDLPLQGQ
jgi:hypothetical protein